MKQQVRNKIKINMKKPIVTFVTGKHLDIRTHLVLLAGYKSKLHSGTKAPDEELDALLKLSPAKQEKFMAEQLAWRYSPNRVKYLQPLADDMNKAWVRIEKEFMRRLEKIFHKPFPYRSVQGILSSAKRFGYRIEERWFGVSMFSNKFVGLDIAMHELSHFMFHYCYGRYLAKQKLTSSQAWAIKEAFTVLLNIEFDDLRFNTDFGYPEHKSLRWAIRQSWTSHRDIDVAFQAAIDHVKNSRKSIS
jgi:hypothetical protein